MGDDRTVVEMMEALDKAATPGPWAWRVIGEKVNGYILGLAYDASGEPLSGFIYDDPDALTDEILAKHIMVGEHEASTCNYDDPALITKLRNALPALTEVVAHYARLREHMRDEQADAMRSGRHKDERFWRAEGERADALFAKLKEELGK